MRAKKEIAANPETRPLSSNPEEEKLEAMKKMAHKKENKIGAKNEEAAKAKAGLSTSEKIDHKSNELEKVVTEQEREVGAKKLSWKCCGHFGNML